ncbi:hypothetical protein V1477_009326 [Vespula maculifrons]|uniref:Uncharacterized protein n=1 Tax=Vespula maculifrons TaxID=7453 RepID=A0ABD2C9F8_VESMC
MCIDRVGVRVERHGTLLPRGSNSPDVIGIQFLPLTATIATAFAAVSATAVIATWQVRSRDKIPGKFCEPFELGYVEEVVKEWYGGVSWKSGDLTTKEDSENTEEDIEVTQKEEYIEKDNTEFLQQTSIVDEYKDTHHKKSIKFNKKYEYRLYRESEIFKRKTKLYKRKKEFTYHLFAHNVILILNSEMITYLEGEGFHVPPLATSYDPNTKLDLREN